jgi:hypothetical protein
MKGIIVNYNGEEIKVAVKEGMITVHLHNNNGNSPALADGESRMYIGGVDYKECKRYTWNENNPIKIGDKFEIKYTDIDVSSTPAKVTEDKNVKRPKTKLESFRELEYGLKKQGLI